LRIPGEWDERELKKLTASNTPNSPALSRRRAPSRLPPAAAPEHLRLRIGAWRISGLRHNTEAIQ
jgi:hypothetical protein